MTAGGGENGEAAERCISIVYLLLSLSRCSCQNNPSGVSNG